MGQFWNFQNLSLRGEIKIILEKGLLIWNIWEFGIKGFKIELSGNGTFLNFQILRYSKCKIRIFYRGSIERSFLKCAQK